MIKHIFRWHTIAGATIMLAVVVLPWYSASLPFGRLDEPAVAAPPRSPTPVGTTPTRVPAMAAPTVAPPPDTGRPYELRFEDLYSGATVMGPVLSDLARSLHGRKITLVGYMAPPLKPDVDFFVLTKWPMSQCPFCSTAADWPFDIVFVRMAGNKAVPALVPTQGIRVTGTFSVGSATDEATGFVSQVRIVADWVEVLR